MERRASAVCRWTIPAALVMLGLGLQAAADEYHFAVEVNGVLCGYGRLVTSPLRDGARDLTLLTHEVVVKGRLLGAPVDNRIILTYHLDPVTKAFSYHESALEQGTSRMRSAIRIDGRTARVSDGSGGNERAVALPADVVLANTLFHPHLVADFVERGLDRKTYSVFDGRDNAVRETEYSRRGTETLRLAGRTLDTIVLDSVDRTTGVNATVWLDRRTGVVVQTRHPGNRRSYLADATVVQAVAQAAERTDLNPSIMSRANIAIPDVKAISYMKVKATVQPSGLWVTPEDLNVPGQRFAGTVEDNLIEGVFEIEHKRYDGRNAPPFPPDFGTDTALSRDLGADDLIQSDDPVLAAKAQEITRGSQDSWEAALRLSRWVAENIEGAIPGGVTARGTYDRRAGECGGHSFLLAALCRSVGIPARAVWGCTYTPHDGGAFGQHAWNEVYMGEAGWVPLDTTLSETDYLDSGHVRIGVFQSVATTLNARKIEILAHRVTQAPGRAEGAAAARLDPYLGEYANAARGAVKVFEQNGALTLDIPGKAVLSFRNPDADGVWRSTISDAVFATFDRDHGGHVVELRLHQVLRLRRTGSAAAPPASLPGDLLPYAGTYLLAQAQAEFSVSGEGQGLVLHDPLARRTVPLRPSGKAGTWIDEEGRVSIRFETGEGGAVTALVLDSATVFRRAGSAQLSSARTESR